MHHEGDEEEAIKRERTGTRSQKSTYERVLGQIGLVAVQRVNSGRDLFKDCRIVAFVIQDVGNVLIVGTEPFGYRGGGEPLDKSGRHLGDRRIVR